MKFIIPGTIYFVYLPVYLTGGSSLDTGLIFICYNSFSWKSIFSEGSVSTVESPSFALSFSTLSSNFSSCFLAKSRPPNPKAKAKATDKPPIMKINISLKNVIFYLSMVKFLN